jgi:hypothetical protein
VTVATLERGLTIAVLESLIAYSAISKEYAVPYPKAAPTSSDENVTKEQSLDVRLKAFDV